MKNVPQKIYLQIDADGETPEDFNELYPSLDVSWCTDKIHPNDIEYTLSNEGEERKFSLIEALDIWEAAGKWFFDSQFGVVPTKSPNRTQYFKEQFNIDL